MKRTLTTAIFCFAVAVAAFAQGGPQKPANAGTSAGSPSVDQILDKYVQALGGKPAIEKVTSTAVKGTFEIPAMGATGALEMYAKAPNKSATFIDIPGFGLVQFAFNGTIAWSQDPQSGMRDITGVELADTKRDADFYREIKLKQLYPKMTLLPNQKVADREAYVIEATPAEGKPQKMYFDVQTGLLVRLDADRESPEGSAHVESYYEDYKEIGGVKMPFTIKIVRPEISFTIKSQDVKQNVPIDDAKFNKPAAK